MKPIKFDRDRVILRALVRSGNTALVIEQSFRLNLTAAYCNDARLGTVSRDFLHDLNIFLTNMIATSQCTNRTLQNHKEA